MIASDEPGYYEEGEFGIRLETDIESVLVETKVKHIQKINEPIFEVKFEKKILFA